MSWKRLAIFYSGVLCGIVLSAITAWVIVANLCISIGDDFSSAVPIEFFPGSRGYEVQLERAQPEFWNQLSKELTAEAKRYCKAHGLEKINVDVVARGDHAGFRLNVDVSGYTGLKELGEIAPLKAHLNRQVSGWFFDYSEEPAKPPKR